MDQKPTTTTDTDTTTTQSTDTESEVNSAGPTMPELPVVP